MPELVVTDLDRTFWDLDCVAPAAHLEALAELEALGHTVLAATGRRVRNVARLFELNGLKLPVVCLDGSVGVDFATQRRFHRIAFEPPVLRTTLETLDALGIRPCLYIDDHGEPGGDVVFPDNPTSVRSHLEFLEQDTNYGLQPSDVELDVLELVLTGLPSPLAHTAAEAVHGQGLGVARVDEPDPLYGGSRLTVSPPGVSKVSGVESFCQQTGRKLHYAAIGDGVNDLELLEAASIKMAITTGYPKLVAMADHLIAPPAEEGWADVPRLVSRAHRDRH